MLIALVSDTHGYVDPRLEIAVEGAEAILHAGDVGGAVVLERLAEFAPVHAVRGNNDDKIGGLGLPLHVDVELGGVRFHIVHQRPHAKPRDGTDIVVFGHSHRPLIEHRGGLLWVNPGAAGRAGFHRIQTCMLLDAARLPHEPRLIELGPRELVSRRVR